MRIYSEKSVLLIIDFQSKLYPHIHNYQQLTQNACILIEGAKILNLPVILTEQYPKGLGSTIPDVKHLLSGVKPIEKISFSCCDEVNFMQTLKESGRKQVIIIGIESHICVLQTALDLLSNGFHPIIVEDCVSSRTLHNKEIAVQRMRQEGAVITSYESILFEMLRFSDSDVFKAVSRLVK